MSNVLPEANFPPQVSELRNSARMETLRIWASQAKSHNGNPPVIHLCNVVSAADERAPEFKKCYYPLNPVRDPALAHAPKVVETALRDEKGQRVKAIVATCSFDPKGHGEQLIFPPKKENEF